MKTSIVVAALFYVGLAGLPAQTTAGNTSPDATAPAPTEFHVVATGPNHLLWQRETYEKGPDGHFARRIHQMTQLASGMNYLDSQGHWVPAQEIIEPCAQGAVARQGQYQVIFASNLNSSGVIDLQTPDGKELRSNILGLGYFDGSTGQAVLVAQVKDSYGTLTGNNQVVYADAFDGVKADVRYIYKKGGFEQDVILKEQPPGPDAYGMNPATTQLEVFTEFIDPPQATVTSDMDGAGTALDQVISWGTTQIGHGRAFDLSDQNDATPVSVQKRYVTLQGRKFLIESVPMKAITGSLNQLPTQSSISRPHSTLLAKSEAGVIPLSRKKVLTQGPMKLAAFSAPAKGYVLDYITLNTSWTNYIFRADMTYRISGGVNLAGVTTLEGGTVLKYDTNSACTLNVLGTLNCLTGPYRPAVFTLADDGTLGEPVISDGSSGGPPCTGVFALHVQNDWSEDLQYVYVYDDSWDLMVDGEGAPEITSGNSSDYSYTAGLGQHYFFDAYDSDWNEFSGDFYPTMAGGNVEIGSDGSFNYTESGSSLCTPPPPPPPPPITALSLANGGNLHDVFFKNFQLAVDSLANDSVWDARFIHCGTALKTEGAGLYAGNILMSDVGIGFSGQYFTARAENLTFDQGDHLTDTPTGMTSYSSLSLTNGILTSVTDSGNVPTSTGFVANLSSSAGIYQTAAAGSYYLPTNSIYRGVGTTGIDTGLLAELTAKTTCPPVVYSNTAVAGGTYPPQAWRDTNSNPDLGYHYDPLDYVFSGVNVSSNIFFPAGTAVGYFELPGSGGWGYGLGLQDSVVATYSGTLTAPCVQTCYSTVQEGNGSLIGPPGMFGATAAIGSAAHNASLAATISARFTLFASHAYESGVGQAWTSDLNFRFTHCVLNSIWANSWDVTICCTNCLFLGVSLGADDTSSTSSGIFLQNCTMHEGSLGTGHFGSSWLTRIQNSAFESVDFSTMDSGSANSSISYYDYNAFVTNQTRLPLNGTHDVIVSSFNWQSLNNWPDIWLWSFYLPTDSLLIDAGSTTADLVGLYHFTTQTNQVKETNSTVDIGYHSVAINTNGLAFATLTNGIPDYLMDANGNGLPDAWEYYWFGNYLQSANELDSSATRTLLDDYYDGLDPNVISFSIDSTNDFVNHTNIMVQLNINGGLPSYYAIFADNNPMTNWLVFTGTNFAASLGTTDGVYDVVVGLKGFATNATETWRDYSFTLDRIPPTLTITNPVLSNAVITVIKPYLQLQGFANKPLYSLSYDISNSTGITTNQDVFVSDEFFDTNKFTFTTNYFCAYDVPLATNINSITLRIADRAGNTTMTNFNVILDYSGATNPPVVTLIWPQNGTPVSGANCTIRGTMSDETGTLVAQVVNGDGTTNLISGMIERNNMFWLENVPLNGTNQISIQAVDASGQNSVTTNFTILPGAVNLVITNVPTGDGLWQSNGSVSGLIGDPSAVVTVNGIQGTNYGNGTWRADNVPIFGRGTATFEATAALPAGGGGLLVAAQANDSPEMAPYTEDVEKHAQMTFYVSQPVVGISTILWRNDYWTVGSPNYPGNPLDREYGLVTDYITQPSSSFWQKDDYDWTASSGSYHYEDSLGTTNDWPWSHDGDDDLPWFGIVDDWQPFRSYADKAHYSWLWHDSSGTTTLSMEVTATTQTKLYTGGKAGINRQNLFSVAVSAEECAQQGSVNAGPVLEPVASNKPLANSRLLMMGQPVGGDGKVWKTLPGNSSGIDITVHAPGVKHVFAFAKPVILPYALSIFANDLFAGNSGELPKFSVGQYVEFRVNGFPDGYDPTNTTYQWAPFPGTWVNASSNAVPGLTSTNYFIDTNLLTNAVPYAWWVSGGSPALYNINLRCQVAMSSGIKYLAIGNGYIAVYKPNVSWTATKNGAVAVDSNYEGSGGNTFLHFGYFSPTNTGVTFVRVVNNDWGFLGNYAPVQLRDTESEACGTNGLTLHLTGNGLDAPDISGNTFNGVTYWDDPAISCTNGNRHVAMRHDAFNTFLMFQTTNYNSISVPLKIISWNWSGAADTNGGWFLTASNSAVTANDQETMAFPVWTNVINGQTKHGFTSLTNTSCQ